MVCRKILAALFVLLFLPLASARAGTENTGADASSKASPTPPSKASPAPSLAAPVVTHHSLTVNGQTIKYTATAGCLPLTDAAGKDQARVFFVAYTKVSREGDGDRPITFAFNGGPGAASVWLQFGGIGPKRVPIKGFKPEPPPYKLTDNPYTWLTFTDLVFIDPVGTGFSRPAPGVPGKEFYGVQQDIHSVGDFIRLYVTKYQRWASPKFIAGESYGTFRAAGLTGYLHKRFGMTFNGLILLSTAVDFQTFSFAPGNDLPYVLFLPTYTAVAFYHHKLAPDLQKDFQHTLRQATQWATTTYLHALIQGSSLGHAQRNKVLEQLARYTGLSKSFLKRNHLRVTRHAFINELLRGQDKVVGVTDGRFTGVGGSKSFTNDPSVIVTIGPYVSSLNNYFRDQLKYKTKLPYIYLSSQVNQKWDYGPAEDGYPNVMAALRKAVDSSRYLKVFVGAGYYDLDTPFFAARYTVDHLNLAPALQTNVSLHYYDTGHMIYVSESALKKLTGQVAVFVKNALPSSEDTP